MKWYFASNDRSHKYDELIKAAVRSALKNTTLNTYFIYDGKPNDLTQWLEKHNVKIIYHRCNFYDELEKYYNDPMALIIASGAFLRCDIPLIEQQDDYVLYTDCDVIFNKDINFVDIPNPEYFACSQEANKDDWDCFNTGVMLMNVKKLRETYEDFKNYIVKHLPELYTFDQTAYQFFYGREKLTTLPEIYNHKPYWGIDKNAVIIHYHGPKPTDFINCKKLNTACYKVLYNKSPKGYDYYLKLFQQYSPIKYKRYLFFKLINILSKCKRSLITLLQKR